MVDGLGSFKVTSALSSASSEDTTLCNSPASEGTKPSTRMSIIPLISQQITSHAMYGYLTYTASWSCCVVSPFSALSSVNVAFLVLIFCCSVAYRAKPETAFSVEKNAMSCGWSPLSSCSSSSSPSSCSSVYSPESSRSFRGDSNEKAPLHQISPVTTPAASSNDMIADGTANPRAGAVNAFSESPSMMNSVGLFSQTKNVAMQCNVRSPRFRLSLRVAGRKAKFWFRIRALTDDSNPQGQNSAQWASSKQG
mmetsp:Transcript_21805/g.33306  ORF Transcript_21805/g.33306 Transcript_21805/m.33306 type:complete len:252 (+) Transcript_21805:3645-4400(+)